MKKLLTIILFALLISSCKKNNTSKEEPQNNLITKIIKPEGGTFDFMDGISVIVPNNSFITNTELTIGYTGNETSSIPNTNMSVIGKPFSFKLSSDTLYNDIEVKFPKPNGYTTFNKTGIIASVNPIIPLFLREEGNFLIAKFDNLVIQKFKSVRPGELIKDLIIKVIIDAHLPMDNEVGLKEVTIDNNGKMVFNNPQNLSNTDKVLLMIHGWTSSPSSCWTEFLKAIKPKILQSGYTKFMTFGYFSSIPINNNGAILANLLQTKLNGAKLDIIAHSMRGLVSRSAIENHNSASYVSNLITLGTPHKGAPAAKLRDLIGQRLKDNFVLNQSYDIHTQGFQNLQPNSTFITQLNTNPQPPTNYYPIAAVGIVQGVTTLDDGVVFKESALGIQGSSNGTIGRVFSLNANIPHIAMKEDNLVLDHVALKLNEFNTSIPTNGLIAFYPFNGNANDESGNSQNGTIMNTPSFASGISGQSIKLTGRCDFGWCEGDLGDHILIPMPQFNSMNSFSINIWVKEQSLLWPDGEAYISFGSDQNNTILIGHYVDEIRFASSNSSVITIPFNSTNINNFQMYTLVFDNGVLRAYQNGILVGTKLSAVKAVGGNVSAIGRHWGISTYTRFNGDIDQVRIYNRTLNTTEISNLYSLQK